MPRKDRSPSSRQNTPLVLFAVVSLLAAGVALALLFASQPPGNDSAEAGFARDMIVHHGQAVQMAEIVRDRTNSDAMRLLASDISLTQQAQVGIMQGWLGVWGLPIGSSEPAMAWMGHPTEGLMPGMATPEEISRLSQPPPRARRPVPKAHDRPSRVGHTDGAGDPRAYLCARRRAVRRAHREHTEGGYRDHD